MADQQVFHRPGPLKQTNKAHKTGRHRSKGAIDNALKGKSSCKVVSIKHKMVQRREQRRNHMNQLRKIKREAVIELKRKLGDHNAPPFLICLLPMHIDVDAQSALAILKNCDSEAVVQQNTNDCCYINLQRFKKRYTFVIPPVGRGNEIFVLDYLKVCDTTVMLTSACTGEEEFFDAWGNRLFKMMSAQHIPTPIVALMDLESINPKKRINTKAAAQKYISKFLPNEKIMQLDTNTDGLNILRRIGNQKHKILHNRDNRPHLFGDYVEYKCNNHNNLNISDNDVENDSEGELYVTGFLRGLPLDVNGLVHIVGFGDFQMSKILRRKDIYKLDQLKSEFLLTNEESELLCKADPLKQTPLQSENIPDVNMDVEQTWPTEDEIRKSQMATKQMKLIKRVPEGFSEYQAAWIPDTEWVITEEEKDEVEDNGKKTEVKKNAEMNEDGSEDDDSDGLNDEFMSCDENSFEEEYVRTEINNEVQSECADSNSVSDTVTVNEEKYDMEMDIQEERETLKKIKEERNDRLWPDEIDTPQDTPARTRFQKYRGLESFRTSPWDAKENLPIDYSRIYQFQNFERTKRRILTETKEAEGVMPGSYITLVVSGVMSSKWKAFKSLYIPNNLIIYGLLPHEHQMSVMNVVLKRLPDSEAPMKSKERLIIQCGYRRFYAQPIYSQHTNGNKHKFERYFRPHSTICATFYAPIQFPSASILVFRKNPDSSLALMAHGSLLSCNPDRIIVKRIVLSGHPMRIHRKSATIRYMFFNKEDVDYFKPVKLRTRCGRVGHIKQSLGTHGHMKCVFDGEIRSYDTVFMYLYKRVYPKWTYETIV